MLWVSPAFSSLKVDSNKIFYGLFASLDIHKKYFHATALEESGEVLVQENFPNSSGGYDSLLAVTGEDVKVALKATYA